jgi:hypothetical protein
VKQLHRHDKAMGSMHARDCNHCTGIYQAQTRFIAILQFFIFSHFASFARSTAERMAALVGSNNSILVSDVRLQPAHEAEAVAESSGSLPRQKTRVS